MIIARQGKQNCEKVGIECHMSVLESNSSQNNQRQTLNNTDSELDHINNIRMHALSDYRVQSMP